MSQLPKGFYRINKIAALRWQKNSKGEYPELDKLNTGALVYANGDTSRGESYFDGNTGTRKIGSWRTDHTWVLALETLGETGDDSECAQGWIDNGKMDKVRNEVETAFVEGDVLYGRWEAREPWVRRIGITDFGPPRNGETVYKAKFNIIDALNNAIDDHRLTDENVQGFADFLGKYCRTDDPAQLRIRTRCKCGLTYITQEKKRQVHFMLDGLDVKKIVDDVSTGSGQGVQRDWYVEKKYCTSAEMRRLMRQRMHDLGWHPLGMNYGIDLRLVSFYLATERVPAPWENGAPANWKWAWNAYIDYRKRKKESEL